MIARRASGRCAPDRWESADRRAHLDDELARQQLLAVLAAAEGPSTTELTVGSTVTTFHREFLDFDAPAVFDAAIEALEDDLWPLYWLLQCQLETDEARESA